jgi:hypothetical protein
MKYATKKNIEKAIDLIMAKGYDYYVASDLAEKTFENVKGCRYYFTAEDFISKILSREEYESQYNLI